MIVASDLDRTLIYSARALREFGYPEGTGLMPVERREEEWVSFMTEASFKLLLEISKKYIFIPITTRTTSQFKRIKIFQKDIPLEYAITTNGATILRNGKPLKEWTRVISSKIEQGISNSSRITVIFRNGKYLFSWRNKTSRQTYSSTFY